MTSVIHVFLFCCALSLMLQQAGCCLCHSLLPLRCCTLNHVQRPLNSLLSISSGLTSFLFLVCKEAFLFCFLELTLDASSHGRVVGGSYLLPGPSFNIGRGKLREQETGSQKLGLDWGMVSHSLTLILDPLIPSSSRFCCSICFLFQYSSHLW